MELSKEPKLEMILTLRTVMAEVQPVQLKLDLHEMVLLQSDRNEETVKERELRHAMMEIL